MVESTEKKQVIERSMSIVLGSHVLALSSAKTEISIPKRNGLQQYSLRYCRPIFQDFMIGIFDRPAIVLFLGVSVAAESVLES